MSSVIRREASCGGTPTSFAVATIFNMTRFSCLLSIISPKKGGCSNKPGAQPLLKTSFGLVLTNSSLTKVIAPQRAKLLVIPMAIALAMAWTIQLAMSLAFQLTMVLAIGYTIG